MPLGKWDRFKLAFLHTLDTQQETWSEIVAETLRLLNDAASTIRDADVDRDLSLRLLRGMHELGTRLDQVGMDYDAAQNDGERKAAIRALETLDTEAAALLAEAREAVRSNMGDLMGTEKGRKVVDQMMADIDWSRGDADDLAFGLQALQTRFGIETVTGKLGHKALPRLYALMSKLPDTHTRLNDHLLAVDRQRPLFDIGGCYKGSEKKIVITMMRSAGSQASFYRPDPDEGVDEAFKPKAGEVPHFNHITLHEIGHAYDHSVDFMTANGRKPEYGGWEIISSETAAVAFGEREGFYGVPGAANIPRSFMTRYLELEIELGDGGVAAKKEWAKLAERAGRAPTRSEILNQPLVKGFVDSYALWMDESDTDHPWPEEGVLSREARDAWSKLVAAFKKAGVSGERLTAVVTACNETIKGILLERMDPAAAADRAIGRITVCGAVTPPWDAMAAHAAVEICRKYRVTDAGHWQMGAEGAKDSTFKAGPYVYTVDSSGKKYRYLAAARQYAVTKYQWHAPAEWFAELYALYFQGKIKETHPAHALFLKGLGEPFEV